MSMDSESSYEPSEHTLDPWGAPEAWRGPPPSSGLAWLALIIVFAGALVAATFERSQPQPGSRVAGDVVLEVQAKGLYLSGTMAGSPGMDPQILSAVRQSATTPGMAWRVAALLSSIDREPDVVENELLPMVERYDEEVAKLGPDVQTLHESVKVALRDPSELRQDQSRMIRDQLGWFGEVLLSHNAGSQNPDRQAAERGAYRVAAIGLLVLVGGGLALLIGTVLFYWKLVTHLNKYGEVRVEMHQMHAHPAIYLEAMSIYLAIALALPVALGFVPGLGESMTLSLGLLAVGSITGVAWPFLRHRAASEVAGDLGLTRGRGVWREIGAGIAGYLTILPVFAVGVMMTLALANAYFLFAKQYGWDTRESEGPMAPHPILQWITQGPAIAKVGILLLAAGFAPLFEETMFRGALLNGAARTIRLAPAILVMAFMFASIHPQGWVAVPALMSLAIGFAFIRTWRRGCLIGSMTAHAVHNGMLVLGLIVLLS